MTSISQIVHKAILRGYLTIDAEQEISQLVAQGCDIHDITALDLLQKVIAFGRVKRLSQDMNHDLQA